MEEQESFSFRRIIAINLEVLLAEPLNLVRVDTAPFGSIQTVLTASVKEPETEYNVIGIFIVNWEPVVEIVCNVGSVRLS